MVNEAFARTYFQGRNPVGRRFGFGDDAGDAGEFEIVGMVGDARFGSAGNPSEMMVFLPMLQTTDESAYTSEMAIRVTGDPAGAGPAVREAVAAVDPRLPISRMVSIDRQVDDSLNQQRLFPGWSRCSAGWPCCSPASGSMGWWRSRSPGGRTRSGSAWRSAPSGAR
jgi:hypothetical protein